MNESKTPQQKIEWLMWFLERIGIILAVSASIIYLAIVYILIAGFETELELDTLFVFAVLGGVIGVMISLSLRMQGLQFARSTKESKDQLKELRDLKGKSKSSKLYPLWIWFSINLAFDILLKGFTTVAALYFSISIIYEGIGDYTYMFLAITNIAMFIGFGMLSLSKGYDRYINYQIPYLQQKIEKLKKEKETDEFTSTKENG